MKVIDPSTGELVREYDTMSLPEAAARIERAHAAWSSYRRTSFDERSAMLLRAAAELRRRKNELATLMATEMGKPIRDGRGEVEKCAAACEYYASTAKNHLGIELVTTEASKSYVAFEPLGVVLAVMPWNFPFWQVFRFAAPALAAGNAGVLKHASNVPGCALAIEDVFRAAGVPHDVFASLLVPSEHVAALVAHPKVAAVTLTGSGPAGRSIGKAAGEHLKKSVLELGGSDAYLVLADADLELAARVCAQSRLINGGQSCIAAKRFIVDARIKDAFEARFVEEMKRAVVGSPTDEKTTMGPLARRDLRDELHAQVERSVSAGARVLLGGTVPEGPGAFYPPTVLTDVRPGMAAFDEELFGPVAAVVTATDEENAVDLANQSIYGLGGAVFTRDVSRGERIARERLEAGSCFVNAFVRSDPRLPFGGIKESGYGRELSGFGIREFVNIKTVYVA